MSKDFNPGGQKGKLHRELGIKPDKKIPAKRLAAAEKSKNPEVRRDAIRAKTMEGWHHNGSGSHDRSSGSGLEKAMHAHADKLHPVGRK